MSTTLFARFEREPDALLAELLTRWQADPDPVLAELIDRVGARTTRPVFTGTLAAQIQAAIAAIGADPLPLPAILEVAVRQRSVAPVGDLLEALLNRRPRDPRLTTLLIGWLDQPPWTSTGSQTIWRRAFRLLESVPDARRTRLADLDPTQGFPGGTAGFITDRRDRLLAVPVRSSGATDAERSAWQAAIAAIDQALSQATTPTRDVAALTEAVFADPSDDSRLGVWADALSEAGDPRGEFVRLQLDERAGSLSRAGRARLGKLLAAHQADWLGPVADVLLKGGRVWERGLLVEACVAPPHQAAVHAALGHPMWTAVRSVDLRGKPGAGVRGLELVVQPGLQALRTVRGVNDAGELGVIARSEVGPQLERVALGGGWRFTTELDTHPPLPAVRSLEVGPIWRRVTRALGTAFPGAREASFVAALSSSELIDTVLPATAFAQLRRMLELAPTGGVRLFSARGDAVILQQSRGAPIQLDITEEAFTQDFWPHIVAGLTPLRDRLQLRSFPEARRSEVFAVVEPASNA